METSYIVLREAGEPMEGTEGAWLRVLNVASPNAGAAIREAADRAGEGTYVAIPARSFKPVTVKVETKKVVSLG